MKIRVDFVTNSSSCCFMIMNTSDVEKTFGDFLKEADSILREQLKERAEDNEETVEDLLKELVDDRYRKIEPKNALTWFGYDGYDGGLADILKYTVGSTVNFIWREFSV